MDKVIKVYHMIIINIIIIKVKILILFSNSKIFIIYLDLINQQTYKINLPYLPKNFNPISLIFKK